PFPDEKTDLDYLADRVAAQMGLRYRRATAIWFLLPTWSNTIQTFMEGLGPSQGLSDIAFGDLGGVAAVDVDADNTYVFDFTPLWQEEGTEYEHDFDKAIRAYWRTATLLRDLVNKPEPSGLNWEVLVPGPIPPWRIHTYFSMKEFFKQPRRA
ncbi:hypothetical protein LCGC14_2558910, partial [marine sediment metagenome]